MWKKITSIFALIISIMVVSGCGQNAELNSEEQVDLSSKSSISLTKDGTIEADIVEDFSENYYDENELVEMVNEEISTYNVSKGGTPIQLISHSLSDGVMSLTLSFDSTESYNDYMPEDLFVGTVNEAYQAGYDFNHSLNVVGKENLAIGKNDLLNMATYKLIILDGDLIVKCPSKILFYSQGMVLVDDTTVASTKEGTYFIIYK